MATARITSDIASVLVEAAIDAHNVTEVAKGIRIALDAFAVDHQLLIDLSEPTVPLIERQNALKQALGTDLPKRVVNTLLALQSRGLLEEFPACAETVITLFRERAQHYEATIESATPLETSTKDALTKTLAKRFNGTVEIRERIIPSLLGGLRVTVGDWRADASVKGRIERLKQQLYV